MSTRLSAGDEELAQRFAQLRTFADVANLLDVEPRKLGYYLHGKANYKVFKLKKRCGGERLISSPVSPLKTIQRKLNQVLLAVYGRRSPVHGFVRGRGIVTNASRHLDRSMILNLDLEDFFPSVHFGRVRGLLEGRGYGLPATVAVTIAQICCHNGTLPAGAPTSPVVSNMVCAQLDSQLRRLAIDCGCTYTRYADDITFSVRRLRFPPAIAYKDQSSGRWKLGDDLARIIAQNGFRVNGSKTRALPRGRKQEVTGLIVGSRANVKRSFVRRTRAMLHACEKWGVDAAERDFRRRWDRKQRARAPRFLRVVRGKVEFVGAVRGRDDAIYLRLLDRYLGIDPRASARCVLIGPGAAPEVLARAVWLLEGEGGRQGSAFAVQGGLITAAHVLAPGTRAACPAAHVRWTPVDVQARHDHVDVARVQVAPGPLVLLRVGESAHVRVGDRVRVLGFPLHRDGASVNIQEGNVTGEGPWHGVPQFVIDCPIVRGNSGGPVLNERNEVVGIALRGQGLPGRYGAEDVMSGFVPIHVALGYL